MVSTRRSTANANRVLADTKEPKVVELPSDAISNKKRPRKNARGDFSVSKSPIIPPVLVSSGSIGDHDINLTSPTIDGVPKAPSTETLGRSNSEASHPDQATSGPQKPILKPQASMSGSCQDPIVVNENSSPPRPIVRPSKRKHAEEGPAEPHRFIANGYRDLYNYGALRSALPRPPHKRSMHDGHQSHDIYKAMNERRPTNPCLNQNNFRRIMASTVPFQAPYPLPTHPIAYQQIHPNFPPSYAQYYHYPAPSVQHYTITSQSEDILRKEAARYVQESRMSPHRQNLPYSDPRKMRSGETESRNSHDGVSKSGSIVSLNAGQSLIPQIGPHTRHKQTVIRDLQTDFSIDSLTKLSSLLTSLLQTYPYSTDQKGLLEDIRAMASIQSQCMISWLNSMSLGPPKHKGTSSDSAIGLDPQLRPAGTLPVAALNDKDKELRQVFAATGAIWQNGTGHGVADVFGTLPSFTPMPSKTTIATNPNQPIPNPIQQGEEAGNCMTIHVITTPTKRVPGTDTRLARTTISPTPSSRYSPIIKRSDSASGK